MRRIHNPSPPESSPLIPGSEGGNIFQEVSFPGDNGGGKGEGGDGMMKNEFSEISYDVAFVKGHKLQLAGRNLIHKLDLLLQYSTIHC
jgi:hypothetical protein